MCTRAGKESRLAVHGGVAFFVHEHLVLNMSYCKINYAGVYDIAVRLYS